MAVKNKLDIQFSRAVRYDWPGTGQKCGRAGFKYRACPSLKHFVRYKDSCHRRDCPDHWRDWLKEESAAAAERVSYVKGRWQHCVMSLGEGWKLPEKTEDRHKELARVRNLLRKVGFTGGAIVAHSARAHTQADVHAGDGGAHYHAYCVGWCDPTRVRDIYRVSGVLIKAFGLDRKRPFQRFQYMLSHAAMPVALNPARTEGSTALHSITYWGVLAYNKLKIPNYEGQYYCPGCNAWFPSRQWHDLRLLADPPPDEWGLLVGPYSRVFEPIGWGE